MFPLFKKLAKFLSGKGLARLPFATLIYQFFYRHLKPKGVIEVTGGGHTLYVDARDTSSAPYLIMHGYWDPPLSGALEQTLKEGMVFVDVGAYIGYFSLFAARIVGKRGRVIAFEPDEHNFSLLEKNVEKNGYSNIETIKKAVSNKDGAAYFYLKKENLSAHTLAKERNTIEVEVETTTLDSFFGKNRRVDVIKIDVEGAEPAVFQGMQSLVQANKKIKLIFEFYPRAIERFGYSPEQFLHDLKNAGFSLYRIADKLGRASEKIKTESFLTLARGEGVPKLINILCVKS